MNYTQCGSALALPYADGIAQTCVTSPPYYGLRDYGTARWEGGDAGCDHRKHIPQGENSSSTLRPEGKPHHHLDNENVSGIPYRDTCGKCGARRIDAQIGLEQTPAAYVAQIVAAMREVWRVLRDDGTLWLNLGDSYARAGGTDRKVSETAQVGSTRNTLVQMGDRTSRVSDGLKEKDLMGIPWRVAFALQDDGWYLRSDIIWAKPNPMPESVQGSHYSRHRITIQEYENLLCLREGERQNKDRAGNLLGVPTRKISGSEAPLSAEREGDGNGTGKRGTRGREGEAAAVQPVQAGATEQGQIRIDGEGDSHTEEGDGQVQGKREGETLGGFTSFGDERPALSNSPKETGEWALHAHREGEGEEAQGLRQAKGGNSEGSPDDGRGLAGDFGTAPVPLPLLWEAEGADARSRNPGKQGRSARKGEHSAGLSELQLEEGEQADNASLIDCPGCPKCAAHNGYILHLSAGRPTKSHEYVFMLSKAPRYFYDAAAIAEPSGGANGSSFTSEYDRETKPGLGMGERKESATRNARSVWTIATTPYSGAHFATMPPELARRCILAGSSARGQCPKCGAPWHRVIEKGLTAHDGETDSAYEKGTTANRLAKLRQAARERGEEYANGKVTTGWAASCDCHAGDPVPQIVLDPFAGSGTTAMVALQNGRRAIGTELNPAYLRLQDARTQVTLGLGM